MIFSPDDEGPIYLSNTERQNQRHDNNTGRMKKVKYKASELIKKLKDEKNVIAKGNLKKYDNSPQAITYHCIMIRQLFTKDGLGNQKE